MRIPLYKKDRQWKALQTIVRTFIIETLQQYFIPARRIEGKLFFPRAAKDPLWDILKWNKKLTLILPCARKNFVLRYLQVLKTTVEIHQKHDTR